MKYMHRVHVHVCVCAYNARHTHMVVDLLHAQTVIQCDDSHGHLNLHVLEATHDCVQTYHLCMSMQYGCNSNGKAVQLKWLQQLSNLRIHFLEARRFSINVLIRFIPPGQLLRLYC